MNPTIRFATVADKDSVLDILDDFRADCMEQITSVPSISTTAKTGGSLVYETLLSRTDYCVILLEEDSKLIGIITGYLCPMLRNGRVRAEIEEFYVSKENRGNGNADKLMNAFFGWCQENNVQKVNLESENGLDRAHAYYKKYGFETKAQRFIKKLGN